MTQGNELAVLGTRHQVGPEPAQRAPVRALGRCRAAKRGDVSNDAGELDPLRANGVVRLVNPDESGLLEALAARCGSWSVGDETLEHEHLHLGDILLGLGAEHASVRDRARATGFLEPHPGHVGLSASGGTHDQGAPTLLQEQASSLVRAHLVTARALSHGAP